MSAEPLKSREAQAQKNQVLRADTGNGYELADVGASDLLAEQSGHEPIDNCQSVRPASGVHENLCSPSSAQASTESVVDQSTVPVRTTRAAAESAYNSMPGSYDLSLPFEEPAIANSRLKQVLNFLYFGCGSICAMLVCAEVHLPGFFQMHFSGLMGAILAFFGLLTVAALTFSVVKPKASHFSHSFSYKTRARLRLIALLLPLPFFAASALIAASSVEYSKGVEFSDAKKHSEASKHLNTALMYNPFNESALGKMAYTENCLFDYSAALGFANRAIDIDKNSSYPWADKAWALNRLERYKEALPVAQKAADLDSTNGEAFASIADAYYGLGNYDDALVASAEHVRLHYAEADAFDQRADILEKLGRSDEAQLMRDQAKVHESAQ